MLIAGSCHCKNISFTLHCEPAPQAIPVRACDCSFCTRHGAAWTALPGSVLKVHVQEPALLSKYAFATKTAEFHVCTRCGVVPLAISRIEGHTYAVVNANTFDGIDVSLLQSAPADFSVESKEERLVRRKRSWISRVEYSEGAN